MTQCNNINAKNYVKKKKKCSWSFFWNFLSNMISDFNEETNFPQKLLLTDRQILNRCKVFENN